MFGFGKKDKIENLIRLGWLRAGGQNTDEAVEKLRHFVFTEAKLIPSIKEVKAEPTETVTFDEADAPDPDTLVDIQVTPQYSQKGLKSRDKHIL